MLKLIEEHVNKGNEFKKRRRGQEKKKLKVTVIV